jgi:hypothetical protein
MAIEERPDDPAIDDPAEGLVVRRWSPLGDELPGIVVGWEAPDPQPKCIGRPAAEAAALGRESFLEAEVGRAAHPPEYRSLPEAAMTAENCSQLAENALRVFILAPRIGRSARCASEIGRVDPAVPPH